MTMAVVIVSRHSGAVEWLRRKGIVGEVIPHVSDPAQIAGKIVVGALPLHLAVEANEVWSIDMPHLSADLRGQDLTPEQMDAAGACINKYIVFKVVEDA